MVRAWHAVDVGQLPPAQDLRIPHPSRRLHLGCRAGQPEFGYLKQYGLLKELSHKL